MISFILVSVPVMFRSTQAICRKLLSIEPPCRQTPVNAALVFVPVQLRILLNKCRFPSPEPRIRFGMRDSAMRWKPIPALSRSQCRKMPVFLWAKVGAGRSRMRHSYDQRRFRSIHWSPRKHPYHQSQTMGQNGLVDGHPR